MERPRLGIPLGHGRVYVRLRGKKEKRNETFGQIQGFFSRDDFSLNTTGYGIIIDDFYNFDAFE